MQRGLLIGPNGTTVLKLEKDLKVKLTLRDPYCFVSTDDQQLAGVVKGALDDVGDFVHLGEAFGHQRLR